MSHTLIVGATGNTGRIVTELLVNRGHSVRVLLRDPNAASTFTAYGVDVAIGDLGDPDSLARACAGVDRAYLAHSVHPDALNWCQNLYAAAAQAGVTHLLRLSAMNAEPGSPVALLDQHGRADRALAESGLGYTVLRPNAFFQNLLAQAAVIAGQGQFYLPCGDALQSQLDVRDVAEAAALILAEVHGHNGAIYELTGTRALGYGDIADSLAAEIGTPVSYIAVSEEQAAEALQRAGLPAWTARAIASLQADFATGAYARISDPLPQLLPSRPRLIEAFLREQRAGFMPHAPR